MNLDILFLGKLFPKEIEEEIKSKMLIGMQDAANALQWNIIEGIDENNCGTIKILDYLPVNSYPRGYTEKYIKEYIFQHTEKYRSDDKVVATNNLRILKHFCNYRKFKNEVAKWLYENSEREKILFVYTASSMFLKLARYVKKKNPQIKTVCMIADLPEFVNVRKLRGLANIYNKYEVKESSSLYKYVDKFILLTQQMAEKLKINSPYLVIEGVATDERQFEDNPLFGKYKNEKYVFYGGTLNYRFGIMTLLDAFARIEVENIKLIICGCGEAESLIKERQVHDERILYLGKIDRKNVLALQKNAVVLINPRQNNEEFTKYSFPSKNLEYLSSGVPLIAYKLDGIPNEYDDYIIYPENDSVYSLSDTITNICNLTKEERKAIGLKAKKFVLENKNNKVQAKKIIDFIS